MKPQVLLVDDRPENLLALEVALDDLEDVSFRSVTSGQDALAAMLEHDFAAVLLDVQMPGMDGFEVARLMRGTERTRFTPILFLTALNAEDQYVFKGYEAGAVDYLTKPFNPDILKSKLRVFIDLYRQRDRIEEMSRALEASNQDLERFAYMISHDLQEPIRVVGSFTQLIAEKYEALLDDEGREFIGYVVEGADRMKRMIKGLLEFSRLNAHDTEFESVSLEACLEDALENLKLAIADSAAVIEHDPLPEVHGDRSLLTQLLQNLLSNAIKYRGEESPCIRIEAESGNGQVCFSVRDNGIGMDSDRANQAFIMFKRLVTRETCEGTGIGLAICKRIVERHNGSIRVESAPGAGSTFTVVLPPRM